MISSHDFSYAKNISTSTYHVFGSIELYKCLSHLELIAKQISKSEQSITNIRSTGLWRWHTNIFILGFCKIVYIIVYIIYITILYIIHRPVSYLKHDV
jgi:hypothetical protein